MSFDSQLAASTKRIAGLSVRLQPLAWGLIGAVSYQHRIWLTIAQGRRTLKEQQVLWEQGRTTPGKIVTWAVPGTSQHEFGHAFDIARLHEDGRVTWNDMPWEAVGHLGESFGLVWGGRWPKKKTDRPHFQLASV